MVMLQTTTPWMLKMSQSYDVSVGTKTNNAFRVCSQTHFNSNHMIFFCLVKAFLVLSETNNNWERFLKFMKMSGGTKQLHIKQMILNLLLEINNQLRVVITQSLLHIVGNEQQKRTVCKSDLLSNCFCGQHESEFQVTSLKVLGDMSAATWLVIIVIL